MSKLIKLKDTNGVPVYLNPDSVALVSPGSSKGVTTIGQSAVVLNNGLTLAIPGDADEVAGKLNGDVYLV